MNDYVHIKAADLCRPNARFTPERQGYQVLTPFGKLGYSQIQQWMGDSRGHWEGQTLVIETTNFNGQHEQVGRPALSSGEHLSLIERFTRVDAETLIYEYTVTDPATWVRPWSAQVPMKKNQDQIYEFACHEGNYSMPVRLAGARAMEREAAAKAATSASR